MPFVDPREMLAAEPLPGWHGRFFHSENMTFAHYDIAADAAPLPEHRHDQEEVWNVVEGELQISIDGVEHSLGPGCVAVVPPNTRHSAQALSACRAIVADYPVRLQLPGYRTKPERQRRRGFTRFARVAGAPARRRPCFPCARTSRAPR
jgi:mannose-6-phosphate isomerase-like protein (cupin superfamily)